MDGFSLQMVPNGSENPAPSLSSYLTHCPILSPTASSQPQHPCSCSAHTRKLSHPLQWAKLPGFKSSNTDFSQSIRLCWEQGWASSALQGCSAKLSFSKRDLNIILLKAPLLSSQLTAQATPHSTVCFWRNSSSCAARKQQGPLTPISPQDSGRTDQTPTAARRRLPTCCHTLPQKWELPPRPQNPPSPVGPQLQPALHSSVLINLLTPGSLCCCQTALRQK